MNNKEEMIKGFEDTILSIKKSRAYQEYCNIKYGYPLRLLNMLSKEDIYEIINMTKNESKKTIIELGCGTGELIELIAANEKLECFGLENSKRVIDYLEKNKAHNNVHYILGDMDDDKWVNKKYDMIFVIDSLYFVENIESTTTRLISSLSKEGVAVVYFTEYKFQSDGDAWKDATKNSFGKILEKEKVKYEYKDITDREMASWNNVLKYSEEFKGKFEEEKFSDMLNTNIDEATFLLEKYKETGGKRFRYMIKNA